MEFGKHSKGSKSKTRISAAEQVFESQEETGAFLGMYNSLKEALTFLADEAFFEVVRGETVLREEADAHWPTTLRIIDTNGLTVHTSEIEGGGRSSFAAALRRTGGKLLHRFSFKSSTPKRALRFQIETGSGFVYDVELNHPLTVDFDNPLNVKMKVSRDGTHTIVTEES